MALSDLARAPWKSCSELLREAVVFVDEGSAELLHWAGGIEILPRCIGMYDLYAPLNAVARDAIAKTMFSKVVFVVTTFLHGKCSQRMSVLLADLQPLTCYVLCSQSERVHAHYLPMDSDPTNPFSHYGEFQALIRKWINRESGVRVAVQHMPLFHCEVCPGLMITPPFSNFFPPLYQTLLQEIKEAPNIENISHELQIRIKSFVSGMDLFLGQLDAKEEIFTFGYFSAMIAKQLCVLPEAVSRRKSNSRRCSLVLVDRTLDLTAPSHHSTEALGDRLLAFPPLSRHCSDVHVDLSPITEGAHKNFISGSLAQPLHKPALQLLKTLMCCKQKECLMEISRLLLEAIAKEHLDIKLTGKLGRPSAQQLRSFLEQFKGHPGAFLAQHNLLQLACAVLQSLEGETHTHWDLLASIEKVLMLGLSEDEGASIALQLCDIVGGREDLCVWELLGMAVSLYALAGPEAMGKKEEEEQLKQAFVNLLLKHRKCDEELSVSLSINASDSKATVLEKLEPVFRRLHHLHSACSIQTYDVHSAVPYCSLVEQLANALFNPSESSAMFEHHPLPQTGLLQSGFSYLKSQPRAEQNPVLVLFVVGGITCSEVKSIREAVASHKSTIEVIVGGTRLQNCRNITTQVLCEDHLVPVLC